MTSLIGILAFHRLAKRLFSRFSQDFLACDCFSRVSPIPFWGQVQPFFGRGPWGLLAPFPEL